MAMIVRVLLFGPQAALAGRSNVDVPLEAPEGHTVAALRKKLAEIQPEIALSLLSARFAVNHEFVGEQRPIEESDEVALIGMVGGG